MPTRPVTSEQPARTPAAGRGRHRKGSTGASKPVDHPSGLAIIASKVAPEMVQRPVLTRARLVGWLEQQKNARVVLISAEAGYGKSTLLGDFARRSATPVVWYRIETSDGDWITFLSYLVAALRGVIADFGRSTEALLRHVAAMGSSRELVLAQFLADLGAVGNGELTVILDDYHLAGDSEDVRLIMTRLLERAPAGMCFVLAGRGRPNLALGRLAAQGRVSELSTTDLRFTRSEIEELFRTTYAQELDRHACDVVAERTQGWAASLQLVSASIAVSRTSEVSAFIDALSGTKGPIYDFLAEEVLSRMSPLTQRILIHASIIDLVSPTLVTAALSATSEATDLETVTVHLRDAQSLGLLGDSLDASAGSRIHPLFRDFLQHQLGQTTPLDGIAAMHLAVAQACGSAAWLAAAKHYALAGRPDDAMRVLGSAASDALGAGAWGAAVEVLALMPETPPPPAVEVIRARALIAAGDANEALALLSGVDRDHADSQVRALVALTSAAAYHLEGDGSRLANEVQAVASDPQVPSPLRDVAISWHQMILASRGARIIDAASLFRHVAAKYRRAGLPYFAGIALHNAATAELAIGSYSDAEQLAREAIEQLSQVNDDAGILTSTQSVIAMCAAETGRISDGLRIAVAAATESSATADAIAEAAYLNVICGNRQRARSLLAKYERGEARWSRDLPSRAQGCYARFAIGVAEGNLQEARAAWGQLTTIEAPDVDARSRYAVVAATLALIEGSQQAHQLALEAVEACASQHAWRWMARARILEAAARRDREGAILWIGEAERESPLSLLELADVIAMCVGWLMPIPSELERSIQHGSVRWIAALGRQVPLGPSESAAAAAALIARYGTLEDALVLKEFDRSSTGRTPRRSYLKKLIRRVSPTVRVHDLGPTSYEVGSREVPLTETRRKAATLLLFLVSRSRLTATKEQVMEGLWPDQSPKSAINSLHQTLFFLRRDIEPWYEDGSTADYVRMEGDMVYLDSELFQVDSVAFNRQVAEIMRKGTVREQGPEMLRLYRGRFAPEFEYEEWAEDWRTQLHAAYLHLAHTTVAALVRAGLVAQAVDVLTPVTAIDPHAFDLRASLISCLASLGSLDAAQAHYRTLSMLHVRDLGVPVRPFDEIVKGLPP